MDIWFSQMDTENVKTSVRVDKQLFSETSEYQRIDVFQSKEFGKMIVLDGEIIFSEADEFIYNEMVVHVPMAVHPHVKNVLIIGGGDGGVARVCTEYPEIETIDVVEPDELFVKVSKEFFPETAKGFDDERVRIRKDFLQENFTGNVTVLCGKTALWSTSTAARFMMRMRRHFGQCTGKYTEAFPSAGYTRQVFQPARRDTGCLDLRPRNTIQLQISIRNDGTNGGSRPGIIPQICTEEHLCCRSILKNC